MVMQLMSGMSHVILLRTERQRSSQAAQQCTCLKLPCNCGHAGALLRDAAHRVLLHRVLYHAWRCTV